MRQLVLICGLLLAGCAGLPAISAAPPAEPPAKRVITVEQLQSMVRVYQAHGVDVGDLGARGQGYLELACTTAALVPSRFDGEALAACALAFAIGAEDRGLAPIMAPPPEPPTEPPDRIM